MLESGDAVDGFDELAPGGALRVEHLRALGRQAVVAAPALARLLDPASLNPAALLEAIEQRIERGDAEAQEAARADFDQLAEVVSLAWLIGDEREDQQLGAPLFQLAIEHRGLHMWHSYILMPHSINHKGPRERCPWCPWW